MRITAIATMALIAAGVAQAGEAVQTAGRRVTVCTEGGAGFGVQKRAQAIASKMFAGIGVTIDWREGLRGCPPQGILVSLTDRTPPSLFPGALAFALPYEGAHIRLFYDRIAQDRPAVLLTPLLAHVLVHEITHILQGINQHSAQGVMKAHWTPDDFQGLITKPLPFTDEDVDRIYRGLAIRTGRPLADGEPSARLQTAGEPGEPVAVSAQSPSR